MSRSVLLHHTGDFRDAVLLLPVITAIKAYWIDIEIDLVSGPEAELFFKHHPYIRSVFKTLTDTDDSYTVFLDFSPRFNSRFWGLFRRIPLRWALGSKRNPSDYLDCLKVLCFPDDKLATVLSKWDDQERLFRDQYPEFADNPWFFLFIDEQLWSCAGLDVLQQLVYSLTLDNKRVIIASNLPYPSLKDIQGVHVINRIGEISFEETMFLVSRCDTLLTGAKSLLRLAGFARKKQIAFLPDSGTLPWPFLDFSFRVVTAPLSAQQLYRYCEVLDQPRNQTEESQHLQKQSHKILYAVSPQKWTYQEKSVYQLTRNG